MKLPQFGPKWIFLMRVLAYLNFVFLGAAVVLYYLGDRTEGRLWQIAMNFFLPIVVLTVIEPERCRCQK